MGPSLEHIIGVNPFKMGVEGGSDSHSTINTFEEFNNQGNHAGMDATAEKRRNGMLGQKLGVKGGNMFLNPGTLTGAWAESNTRGAIFDAMARKETYATVRHGSGNHSGTCLDIADLVRGRQTNGQVTGDAAMKTVDYSRSIEFGNAASYRIVVQGALRGVLDMPYGLHLSVISVESCEGD